MELAAGRGEVKIIDRFNALSGYKAGANLCEPKSARLVVPFPVLLGTRYSVLFGRAGHLYAARVRRVARDAFVQRFGNLLAVSVAAQLLFVRRAADE